jgi:hypothetical protein
VGLCVEHKAVRETVESNLKHLLNSHVKAIIQLKNHWVMAATDTAIPRMWFGATSADIDQHVPLKK